MPNGLSYEAVKLLAQARAARQMGEFDRAIDLLHQVLDLKKIDKAFARQPPYRSAHIELYKAYCASGRKLEATYHHQEATKLGATQDEMDTSEG